MAFSAFTRLRLHMMTVASRFASSFTVSNPMPASPAEVPISVYAVLLQQQSTNTYQCVLNTQNLNTQNEHALPVTTKVFCDRSLGDPGAWKR